MQTKNKQDKNISKQKLSQEEVFEQIKDRVEWFLKKYHVSGIFHINGIGTFSLYENEGLRLQILEHADIEIKQRQKMIKEEVETRIQGEHDFYRHLNQQGKSYIG